MHEQPFRIIPTNPINIRKEFLTRLNTEIQSLYDQMSESQMREFLRIPEWEDVYRHKLRVKSKACPRCNDIFWKLVEKYAGDWQKVIRNHLRVKRMLMSRDRRVGIAITRPKSEKDQDASEWTGETNYQALAKFGSPVDPRTFEFRGYFEAAEGGMLYSEEFLKLSQTFLYDYLGAAEEHRVQPKGFNEVDIDIVIIGGTNEPEYKNLIEKKEMEALRDRIVLTPFPYIGDYEKEADIYRKFFNEDTGRGKHRAPFTLAVAAFFAVSTRLEPSNRIPQRQKVKLYAGRSVEGFTDDAIKELKKEADRECREGISPRFIIDRISAATMKLERFRARHGHECTTPFAVLREIEEGLEEGQHTANKTVKEKYKGLLEETKLELSEWIKNMVQEIIAGDEEALKELHSKYIDNLMALNQGRKLVDMTGTEVEADQQFLEAIEMHAQKTDTSTREAFRTKITNAMARRAMERERDMSIPHFTWNTDEVLAVAYKGYLFAQQQKTIDWEALLSKKVVGEDTSKRLAAIQDGLSKKGCCPVCASVFISHVAGIFVRGQKK